MKKGQNEQTSGAGRFLSEALRRSAGLVLVVLLFSSAVRGEAIDILLVDGKQIRADRLERESENQRLVLYVEGPGIRMSRSVSWDRVSSVRIGDASYGRDELQELPVAESKGEAEGGMSTIGGEELAPIPQETEEPAEVGGGGYGGGLFGEEIAPVGFFERPAGDFCEPRWAFPWLAPPLPTDAVVIGVREDPLAAYQDAAERFYPHGIPVLEAPFALQLLQAQKADEVFLSREVLLLEGEAVDEESPEEPAPPPVEPMLQTASPLPLKRTVLPAIRSVEVAARGVSQAGGVDWDALAVEVQAFDGQGRPVPARGILRLTLWGQQQELVRAYDRHFLNVPGRVERIAAWTKPIPQLHPHATGPALDEPARVVVPLPRPLPDHDLSRYPLGELHAQLVVPGQGVVESTRGGIVLKQASPLRDQLLRETGSRFFAHERTSDSVKRSGFRYHQPSSLRPHSGVFTVQP